QEITRGLVGHWKFDEGEGPTARDSSANANHVTLQGARWAAGRTGGALSFGEGQALAAVESPRGLPSGDAPKTIAAWFKARALAGRQNIGGFGNNAHGENFQLGVSGGHFVVWGWWIGKDWHTKVGAAAFADGEWHHIAASYEAKTTKLYLDGRERASTDKFIYGANPRRIVIGNEIDKVGHRFGGAVDEFRIYDRALAPEEVATLAGVRPPAGGAPTRGLLAHWKFDEGEGKAAGDASGKGNDGLLQNDPTWAAGKLGGALSFNGRNSYVDVRPPPGLTGSAITVSAWVKYAEVPTGAWSNVVIAQDDSRSRVFQLVAKGGRHCWHRFNTGKDLIAGDRITPGVWQHVAATFDGTKHSLYIDGELEAEAPGTLRLDRELHVRIGMKGSGEFPFKGLIDDVRIYDRGLSGAEVKALFEGRSGPVPPPEPEEPEKPAWLLVDLDPLLMKGDHAGAQAWLAKAAGDDKYAEATDEIAAALGVAGALEARGKAAAAGAEARVGKETQLAGRSGRPRKGEVKAVTGKGIDLVTKFVIATGGKRLEREKRVTVVWAELALDQVAELAREGGWKGAGADAAVARAYLALGRKKVDLAEKALAAATDHPLAAHLGDLIAESGKPAARAAPKTGMAVKRGPTVPARGLVGWWRFDELKGTAAKDHSGKGNHGTIKGATWVKGRTGGALSFSDPGHYVEIADHPALDLTQQFTIATWVCWRAPGGRRSTILAKALAGRVGNYAIRPRRGSTGFGFLWDNVGAKGTYSTIELTRNAWNLIVVTADAAHPTEPWMKIYVDGAEAATYAAPKFRTSRRPRANDDPLYIGGMPNETNDCDFNGLIDDVLIYNRVLSAAEMRSLLGASAPRQPPRVTSTAPAMAAAGAAYSYKIEASGNPAPKLTVKGLPKWLEFDGTDTISGTPGKGDVGSTASITIRADNGVGLVNTQRLRIKVLKVDPGLAGWWKFDEVTGAVARDSSGRGNHAKITGGTRVRGRAGNALGFDGKNDYVELPSAATSGLKTFTFSLWVKTTEKRGAESHWHRPCLFGQATKGGSTGDLAINTSNGYVGMFHGLYARGDKIHLSATRRVNDGTWHHIALANDGESAMLYVDGVREAALPTGLALNNTAFRVGAQGGQEESGFHHSGVIDDVRVYTRALSAAEIAALAGPARAAAGTGVTDPREMKLDLGGGVLMEFVLVPAGRFSMGEKGVADPVHRVTITKPFYLGKYEVTQAQYEKVTGKNPSEFKGAGLPVEQVSWADTQRFMAKANDLRTRSGGPLYTFRLPTEAEWEYACRAGTRTEYNTGQGEAALVKAGWYSRNSGGKTSPVGKKAPNALGLHDMHGNVSEIVQDRAGRYSARPAVDPRGPSEGWNRVHRGGSWKTEAGSCRSASRGNDNPGLRRTDNGFRCVVVERHKAAAAAPVVEPNKPNVIAFPAAKVRFVRFAINASSSGAPCIDELEVYGPAGGPNLALAKNGAVATASSCIRGYPIHKIAHLNDGLYGNSHSWIAHGKKDEWAQIKLPRKASVAKVVFSRDRNGRGRDRIPIDFAIQLSLDGKRWKTVREVKATVAPRAPGPWR
ncbi:MAG: LamG-like jellyroll fold domain-containing protein, partial [Planctomycetota bacterium]